MDAKSIQFQILLAFLFINPYCQFQSEALCKEAELKALLGFKSDIEDLSGRLTSWVGTDCCRWRGVGCNDSTGRVISLDLRNPDKLDYAGTLRGKISPSLLGLKHLRYLDLSKNSFDGTSIPGFIGSFEELRYLNLSKTGLVGIVPSELGNLSSVRYLDLQSDNFIDGLYLVDALWLSRLSSIRYLDMSGVNLSNSTNWLQSLNMLPSVKEIRLSLCQLDAIPTSLPSTNFTALEFLDLSLNNFNSTTIPEFLFGISSLKHLDLRDSKFGGPISDAIENLTSLEFLELSGVRTSQLPRTLGKLCKLTALHLDHALTSDGLSEVGRVLTGCAKDSLEKLSLSENELSDQIPDWIGNLRSLKVLDLSTNRLYGPIPASIGRLSSLEILGLSVNELNETVSESLGQLSNLISLDLTYNSLRTTLTEAHFAHLKSLKYLNLFNSSLGLNMSSDWLPPFQVEYLYTRGCRFGPRFPSWLRNQRRIRYLDMSGAGISDSMPDWFWNVTSHMTVLFMSDNQISGKFPISLKFANSEPVDIDLSNNRFEGRLPQFPSNVEGLYLSANSLSGSLPPNFGHTMPNLTYFSISSNSINGSLPLSLCDLQKLKALDLSKNQFSGHVLDCWDNFPDMQYLNLANNHLFGNFPQSLASLRSLQLLDLSSNTLSGNLPGLVEYVTIDTLDLGQNGFAGNIPSWIGDKLQMLRILSLRSNSFVGSIPPELSNLQYLHILDLSDNNLSGNIPKTFANLTGMKKAPDRRGVVYYDDFSWDGLIRNMWVMTKGRYLEYGKLLTLLTVMDLSANNLSGEIPDELTGLYGLQSLNLSGNKLTGNMSEKFGKLALLETFDLSRNNLSGRIPSSLSGLNFLSHLNLSYNHLIGRIPSGGQLNTFDASIYAGNDGLCGFPSTVNCEAFNRTQYHHPSEDGGNGDRRENEMHWYLIGAGPGFLIGFWIFWGALLLNSRRWDAYFRYVDSIGDRISGICIKHSFLT